MRYLPTIATLALLATPALAAPVDDTLPPPPGVRAIVVDLLRKLGTPPPTELDSWVLYNHKGTLWLACGSAGDGSGFMAFGSFVHPTNNVAYVSGPGLSGSLDMMGQCMKVEADKFR